MIVEYIVMVLLVGGAAGHGLISGKLARRLRATIAHEIDFLVEVYGHLGGALGRFARWAEEVRG